MQHHKNKMATILLITFAILFAGTCCATAMDQININTAPVEKLIELERIGAKYAQRIVEHREMYGPFEKPEEIMNVKGIGEKTWEANKDRIVI